MSTLNFPFQGDSSLLRPASNGFQCHETLQTQTADSETTLDYNDGEDEVFTGQQKIIFNCTLPQEGQSLVFICLEPSCGVLLEEESAAEKEEDGQMDPFFFDEGYTLAGKTGFQVWPGSRLMVEALTFCAEEDCEPLVEWQRRIVSGNLRVLELGSGVGVVGVSLAAAGAQVLLTDLKTLVQHSTRLNLKQNKTCLENEENAPPGWLPDNAVRIHKGWAASCAVDWTVPLDEQISNDTLESIDVVLASDCVWLVSMMEPLLETVECVFRARSGRAKFLLSFQRRDPKIQNRETTSNFTTVDRVLQALEERNWSVRCLAWRLIHPTDPKEVFLFEASPILQSQQVILNSSSAYHKG
mmetsp:Transcript_32780/g.49411  ORF Transcript_32780/g.49411 Transcript_32780/m.49411 type:complete len:355 (+) Transcript_32780:84-1148(+)|eukprot:CAMPEP_0178894584 /NCGR_PEP_ID=MMETSP0786-20121207/99_1 /TAXON_ID=186022 /ORGANISM="Thalassionema frauenfeldii, Strain CCMP 1798" /LENGTH=354 /DNA_ID=CAMNT_0020564693 /DNA_START=61 /DNA_END=1125 /DNA_ORIENTATION=-